MRKIIISAAVAAMALSTTASALEDIKVSGQAKLWYETSDTATTNAGATGEDTLFHKDNSQAEVVFKLGMTGKQGNVGFGVEMTQGSTMGLENVLVSAARTHTANQAAYVSKAYFTAPMGADTTLKMGRQELNTPLAFTEKWNAGQNNFDAAVVTNSSISNLTLLAAYVGQTNTGFAQDMAEGNDPALYKSWKATNGFNQLGDNGAIAIAGLYKTDAFGLNVWGYNVTSVANAVWADASFKAGPVALKAYAAMMMPADDDVALDDTTAFALSAGMKAGEVKLFAAASMISDDLDALPMGNIATGFKKTKLPTAGVYTDGLYVAQPGSTAVKLKAATKLGSTGLALQAVMNMNDDMALDANGDSAKETTEVDLIATQKVGDFNLKGILMHRSFASDSLDDSNGGIHARVIASVNF